MITVGDKFPEFSLEGVVDGKVEKYSRKDFLGKYTFLVFYPEDFSFICPTEIMGFEQHREAIYADNGLLFGISTDDLESHKLWSKEIKIHYPLISDPQQLSSAIGILDDDNRCKRATLIINPDGIVEYISVTTRNVGRSVKEAMRVYSNIKSGRMCPVDWVE